MLSDERASPSDADGLSRADSLRPGARSEKRVEHPPSDEQVVTPISPRIEEVLSRGRTRGAAGRSSAKHCATTT